MQRYLRIRDLATTPAPKGNVDRKFKSARTGRLPVSPATIWRWVKLGQFPAPVHLSGRVTAWTLEAVELWEQQRTARHSRGEGAAA